MFVNSQFHGSILLRARVCLDSLAKSTELAQPGMVLELKQHKR
jgi:hypothetical protein